MTHDSPLPDVDVDNYPSPEWNPASVRAALRERCPECREHLGVMQIV
jgi:hypothetical protein